MQILEGRSGDYRAVTAREDRVAHRSQRAVADPEKMQMRRISLTMAQGAKLGRQVARDVHGHAFQPVR
jgi:hypothetical protein